MNIDIGWGVLEKTKQNKKQKTLGCRYAQTSQTLTKVRFGLSGIYFCQKWTYFLK